MRFEAPQAHGFNLGCLCLGENKIIKENTFQKITLQENVLAFSAWGIHYPNFMYVYFL